MDAAGFWVSCLKGFLKSFFLGVNEGLQWFGLVLGELFKRFFEEFCLGVNDGL